ncbi:1996_t:CDS:2, partial [Racocetra persica]
HAEYSEQEWVSKYLQHDQDKGYEHVDSKFSFEYTGEYMICIEGFTDSCGVKKQTIAHDHTTIKVGEEKKRCETITQGFVMLKKQLLATYSKIDYAKLLKKAASYIVQRKKVSKKLQLELDQLKKTCDNLNTELEFFKKMKVYYDLLKEIRRNYTKSYTLTLLLIEVIRNFGWIEFDPSEDAKKISAIQNIKNWFTNKNKLLLTIRNYITTAPKNELSVDDSLYSDQAQSLSAKDRGVRKFGDVIGYFTGSDKILYEIFFVEVSYGLFYKDSEPHIDEDKIKLGKLGKDSIDRISRLLNTED